MEGVMMRGKKIMAVSVRAPDGNIKTFQSDIVNLAEKYPILNWPIVRGVVSFISSLAIGYKIITQSSEVAMEGLEEEEEGKFEAFLRSKLGDRFNDFLMTATVILGVAFSIGLFMLLPVGLGQLVKPLIGDNRYILSVIEGVLRIGILVGYMLLLTRVEELRRVFGYHGAEHKTINCFEHGEPLTVENVRKHSRLHKRCGTSFLFLVMLIALAVFMFVPSSNFVTRLISRVLLVPIIAGISYEVLKWAGRNDNPLVNAISFPGMCLQKITTDEPDDDMIKTAISALRAVLRFEPEEKGIIALTASAERSLSAAGIDDARKEARALLTRAADMRLADVLLAQPEDALSDEQAKRYEKFVSRRVKREPMAYIVGVKEFYRLEFEVTPDVLIPRPETEMLVELASGLADVGKVLELCTGSGCVAVSLAKEKPLLYITAADISEKALRVARRNAQKHNVNVLFAQSDLFTQLPPVVRYDMIIANPPYIRSGDISTLAPDIKDYEPKIALDGGLDGSAVVFGIIRQAKSFLTPGGVLLVEIGPDQSDDVLALASRVYDHCEIKKDLAGLDRVAVAYMSATVKAG
jgi:release factor-specific protein-(glutamine-N5) methyltransferase